MLTPLGLEWGSKLILGVTRAEYQDRAPSLFTATTKHKGQWV